MVAVIISGCSNNDKDLAADIEATHRTSKQEKKNMTDKNVSEHESYNIQSKVGDVRNANIFKDYGRLIFPVDIQIDDSLQPMHV